MHNPIGVTPLPAIHSLSVGFLLAREKRRATPFQVASGIKQGCLPRGRQPYIVSHASFYKMPLRSHHDRQGLWLIYIRERNLGYETLYFSVRVSVAFPKLPAETVNLKTKVKVLVASS
ncbi:hypothetical protein SAMN05216383_10422 [Prevotella sp. KH2C16]|nr:hypothetical protein SAMN05216383_10422 [Prevotella sp. KH2C16]